VTVIQQHLFHATEQLKLKVISLDSFGHMKF